MPRWFTEGLSRVRDGARAAGLDAAHARRAVSARCTTGSCCRWRELNAGFTHARDVAHMVVAYHQAAEEVAFLIRRLGFDKVVEALKLFARGQGHAAR